MVIVKRRKLGVTGVADTRVGGVGGGVLMVVMIVMVRGHLRERVSGD